MRSAIFCVMTSSLLAQEFIVPKKVKTKKEIAAHVKEDIVELLESSLRQIGVNIQQAVSVQNKILDQIKDMLTDDQLTTAELKDVRSRLEKNLKMFELQQSDLQDFLLQSQHKKS